MILPKVKVRKMIKEKEFIKVAKKVRKSMEDEAKYLHKRRIESGNDSNSLNALGFH